MPRWRSPIGRSEPDLRSSTLRADAWKMHHSYRAVVWRLLPIMLLVAFVAIAARA